MSERVGVSTDEMRQLLKSEVPFCFQNGRRVVGLAQMGLETSAQRMYKILKETYGKHDLMRTEGSIRDSIASGRVIPLFMDEAGQSIACAGLVDCGDAWEIGRAANAPGGAGGTVLMRKLVQMWQDSSETRPVIAEVRMAAEFDGIEGGQGSQRTLFGADRVGGKIHGVIPAFHHPGPKENGESHDRHEMFGLMTLEKNSSPERIGPSFIALPNRSEMNIVFLQSLLQINGYVHTEICVPQVTEGSKPMKLALNKEIPFNDLRIATGEDIEFVPTEASNKFDLVKIDADNQDIASISNSLLDQGFICCGIDAPYKGKLKLLFGRLRKTKLAQTQVIDGGIPGVQTDLIIEIHRQFEEKMHQF